METAMVYCGNEFDRLLAQSVDEGFGDLLGESVKQALYTYLEHDYAIPRSQIPIRLEDFGVALERTFGVSSRTVGRTIAKRLYVKLRMQFVEKPDFGFLEYVKEAKMNGKNPQQ